MGISSRRAFSNDFMWKLQGWRSGQHWHVGGNMHVRCAGAQVVVPVLPWLLVSSGRLDTRDLTHIASQRGLSALLELGLCRVGGALAVRGTPPPDPPPPTLTEVSVSSFLATSAQPGAGSAVVSAGTLR